MHNVAQQKKKKRMVLRAINSPGPRKKKEGFRTFDSGGDGGGWACFAAEPSDGRGAIGCRPDIDSG